MPGHAAQLCFSTGASPSADCSQLSLCASAAFHLSPIASQHPSASLSTAGWAAGWLGAWVTFSGCAFGDLVPHTMLSDQLSPKYCVLASSYTLFAP